MSDQTAEVITKRSTNEFRGSLVRTTVILLVVLSIIPALVISFVSYFQFQTILKTQTDTQISSLAQTNSSDMEQQISVIQSSLTALTSSSYFATVIPNAKDNLFYFYNNQSMVNYLGTFITNMSDYGLSSIQAVRPDGYIVLSSQNLTAGSLLSHNKSVLALIGQSNKSALILNPDGNYPNQLILVTVMTKRFVDYPDPLTFFYFTKPNIFTDVMTNPKNYFTSANVFFITTDKKIVTLNPVSRIPELKTVDDKLQTKLLDMASKSGNGKEYTYTNFDNRRVYSYMRPSNYMDVTYVLEVPTTVVQDQIQKTLNYILIMIAAALLFSAVVSFIGARGIATPLVSLSDKARKFANGDFSQKAAVNRRDEIGMLASSFNYMVEQLSAFYSSLESKVAERTEQLRTVSEIAMDAVSESNTGAILRRVTRSIVEKLGFPYASVYLLDKTAENALLTEDYSEKEEPLPQRGLRLSVNNTSLVGAAASSRQVKISANVQTEKPKLLDTPLLKSTLSEISLPIMIGERLIGILDIQSDQQGAFDPESLPAFTTLTTQLSNGLRNIELLESTQVSLQETAVLYSATRAISQATEDEQIIDQINKLFIQTSYASFFLDIVENGARIISISDAQPLPSDSSILGIVLPLNKAAEDLNQNGTRIVSNFQLLSDFSSLNTYFGRRGCHSAAMIPVYEGKQLKHILAIGSREESSLTAINMQPYENFVETIGASLEKIHLNEALTQKERDMLMLNSIFSEVDREKELANVYPLIHEEVHKAFGDQVGLCVAYQNADSAIVTVPYYFDSEYHDVSDLGLGNDLIGQVIRKGEKIVLDDVLNSNLMMINSGEVHPAVRSFVGIPLFKAKKCIGTICLFSTEKAGIFNKSSEITYSLLSAQISLLISLFRQDQDLKDIQSAYDYEKYLLNTLMESIPDRISFKDNRNQFIRLSASMAQFLGASKPDDLIGKKDDYIYLRSDEAFNESILSAQEPVINHQEQWTDREGNQEWIITNRIPLMDTSGSINGLLSISSNITDQVKTRQLAEHRADQLLTASDIAQQSTTGTMDIEVTLSRLVDLIKARFDFYHASVFLIDRMGKYAVLRESTGEAGAQLKERGHKLAVGSPSIVGQATGKGQPVVIGDVTKEDNYFANPLLPLTRSEMAIPMKIGDRILGAVDVQSTEYDAFSQDDINILQVLANQAAVAVQNEDLYSHTNESLSRHRLLNQMTSSNVENMTAEDAIRATLEVLHQAMPEEQITYFVQEQGNQLSARASVGLPNTEQTAKSIPFGQGIIGRAAAEGKPIQVDDVQFEINPEPQNFETNSILAVPVMFADKVLGVLNVESTELARFDLNDEEFVSTVATNMGSIISNINLVDQVRDQVNRQQKLIEITSKLRRSVDINTIMQTSVTEIASAMNIRKATIKINPGFETGKEDNK
jgi:PAS domain S-box-containing protein